MFHSSRFTLHVSFLIISIFLIAWGSRGFIKEGNKYYAKEQYRKSVEEYRRAGDSPIVRYNLGNAFYKQQKYKEAIKEYRRVLVTEDINLREKAYYNMGNAQVKSDDLESAISSYKNALRLDQNDWDAKHNLEYAIRELKRKEREQGKQSKVNKKKQKKAKKPQDKYQEQAFKKDVKRVLRFFLPREAYAIRKEEKELQRKLLYRKLLEAKETTVGKDW